MLVGGRNFEELVAAECNGTVCSVVHEELTFFAANNVVSDPVRGVPCLRPHAEPAMRL